jgi:phosphoribosyl 1,2-cyclic phosphodiesterase
MAEAFTLTFWGVRGSVACPGPDTVRYGGNTSCVAAQCGEHLIVFDGGTGLRPLGNALQASGMPVDADLFFSHSHIDHICGIPFFSPLYDRRNSFRIWSGHLGGASMARVFDEMMREDMFPVSPAAFQAHPKFHCFSPGETLRPHDGIALKTAPLNHPGGATGYRLEFGGKAIAYLTDTEHRPGAPDANILALAAGVDVMIYDCTYTDAEFGGYAGWGHSTWQEAVRLAERCGAKRVAIFHHDPSHDDAFMDGVARDAEAMRPGTFVAQEGLVLALQ